MAWETSVQSQSYQRLKKWYLMPLCLTFSIIKYVSRVKWSNPGEGVAPSPTPRCSSYWKRNLRVTLVYGRQLYFLLLLQIFKTIKKSEFRVLIKHCFLIGKIIFKQSNGLISVIWTLLRRKQRLRSDMQTLNEVVQTQMIQNAHVTKIRKLSRKTPNSFWPIVNWSCVR